MVGQTDRQEVNVAADGMSALLLPVVTRLHMFPTFEPKGSCRRGISSFLLILPKHEYLEMHLINDFLSEGD